MRAPLSSLPLELDVIDAVEAAYGGTLAVLVRALRRSRSLLLAAHPHVVPALVQALRTRLRDEARAGARVPRLVSASGAPRQRSVGAGLGVEIHGSWADQVWWEVVEHAQRSIPNEVLVVANLHLLVPRLGELVPLLQGHPEARVWGVFPQTLDPPAALVDLFRFGGEIVELPEVRLEQLPQLITRDEARVLSDDVLDVAELHPRVAHLDAVALRAAFVGLRDELAYDPRDPSRRARALSWLAQFPQPPVLAT